MTLEEMGVLTAKVLFNKKEPTPAELAQYQKLTGTPVLQTPTPEKQKTVAGLAEAGRAFAALAYGRVQ